LTMTSVKAWPLLLLPLSLVSMGTADCPFPVLNGKIILSSESILKNSFPDNSVAFVECAKGYVRKEGSTSITCLNGVWSAVELICKNCGEPTRSPHMSYVISDGTLFGAYIKTICETGYDLEGSSHRQCLVSGWSGKAECILTTCNLPDPIEHGKMSAPRDKPEFNDVITFSCDDNYILVGNSFITCGEYGDYSSPPPKSIECPVPEISFSTQTEGNPPYSFKCEATFECWPGYRMKGLATSVCEKSGCSSEICGSFSSGLAFHIHYVQINMWNVELEKMAKADNNVFIFFFQQSQHQQKKALPQTKPQQQT
uniref:Im:7151449 n=1 Tax=Sinocyclocheilus rhinocerous TaxID=307959 RepID=A0A673MBX4_9TELE